MEQKELKEFKVGDRVTVFARYGWEPTQPRWVTTVAKVGKRDLVLANDMRFRLDGSPSGGYLGDQSYTVPVHWEKRHSEMIARNNRLRFISNFKDWNKLSDIQLFDVHRTLASLVTSLGEKAADAT